MAHIRRVPSMYDKPVLPSSGTSFLHLTNLGTIEVKFDYQENKKCKISVDCGMGYNRVSQANYEVEKRPLGTLSMLKYNGTTQPRKWFGPDLPAMGGIPSMGWMVWH